MKMFCSMRLLLILLVFVGISGFCGLVLFMEMMVDGLLEGVFFVDLLFLLFV